MLHKLWDIFGKDNNAANRMLPVENLEDKTATVTDSNSNKVTANTKIPATTASVPQRNDNLFTYLKSTAYSAEDRDQCLGCKITASVLITVSVLFGQFCIQKKKAEALEYYKDRTGRRLQRPLILMQVGLVGVWGFLMYTEWMEVREKSSIKDNKAVKNK